MSATKIVYNNNHLVFFFILFAAQADEMQCKANFSEGASLKMSTCPLSALENQCCLLSCMGTSPPLDAYLLWVRRKRQCGLKLDNFHIFLKNYNF